MNSSIKHLSNILALAAFALPLTAMANQPVEEPTDDIISTLSENVSDPTSSFLILDDEGRQEIAELGLTNFRDELASQIIDYADSHLGRPYRRGAKGPSAFDCSGFTSYIFKNYDIALSPSSRTQYTQGRKISKDEIQPGDLLFFSGRRGGSTVGHVALAVDVDDEGRVKFIHASNSKGITYDTYPDGGYYSKRFLGARRVIE